MWSPLGEEQDLQESPAAMGTDGEKRSMNKLIWKMEDEAPQAAEPGTKQASRCSRAGPTQGLCDASVRANQGLGAGIQETCFQFFCTKGL